MPIIQLEYQPEYLEEVVKLEYEFDRDHGVSGDIVESTIASVRERILDRMQCDYQHFVSLTDTNVADGYLYAFPYNNDWVRIAGIYVRKESRRKGVAENLKREFIKQTKASIMSHVSIENQASILLNTKLGFKFELQASGFFLAYLSK